MKKQKGFTLIELLAVIVILAIIALIATPMIMDVIDKAKKGAAEASANGYIEAIEKYSLIDMIDNTDAPGIPSKIYDLSDTEDKAVLDKAEVKGEKPISGWVYVNTKGMVEAADLKFKSYSAKSIGYVIGNVSKATKNADTTAVPENAADAKKTVENAINGTTTPDNNA